MFALKQHRIEHSLKSQGIQACVLFENLTEGKTFFF
jgi:hypothetical protein